eukprot:3185593-Pyramimonas_sp.AAC.1
MGYFSCVVLPSVPCWRRFGSERVLSKDWQHEEMHPRAAQAVVSGCVARRAHGCKQASRQSTARTAEGRGVQVVAASEAAYIPQTNRPMTMF